MCRVKRRRLMRTRGPRVGVRGHVEYGCVHADCLDRCMHLLFGCNWDAQRMRIKKNITMKRPAE